VQCHFCGKWMSMITTSHIATHGFFSLDEYRKEFGLKMGTALCCEKIRVQRIHVAQKLYENGVFHFRHGKYDPKQLARARESRKTIEYQNEHGTCKLQAIEALRSLSASNPNITFREMKEKDPIHAYAILRRYGTFNNAKKIAGLMPNKVGIDEQEISKSALILDIRDFKAKYGRNPSYSDFNRGLMICSSRFIRTKYGSLNKILSEATGQTTKAGGQSSLTSCTEQIIVALYRDGRSQTELAAKYDVSTTAIRRVLLSSKVPIRHWRSCKPV
jgi:hypothetical protein